MKMHWFTRVVIFGFSLCWLMASPASQTVKAAGIVVNSAEDVISTNSKCSLREAIINANNDSNTHTDCAAGSGSDTITFANNYIITLNGSQLPSITSTIIITGNGISKSIIQAHEDPETATWRVINVEPSGYLTLNGITIQNGKAGSGFGGGIYNNEGALTINECSISGNIASGGAIFNNEGTTTITNSFISNNSAGTILNAGGIYNSYGALTISGSTFYNNSGYNGGGIFNIGSGSVTVTNSTFSANTAENRGGGIMNFSDGSLTLNHSTFFGNSAGDSGGGIYINTSGKLYYSNTIIANSAGGDCINLGSINSNTGNLVEDGTCTPDYNGDPLLEPLSDNGGPTLTHALNGDSHAIDFGNISACTATDQRGVSRPQPQGGNCDIGAYEVDLTSPIVSEFIAPSPSFILKIPITSFTGSDNNNLVAGFLVTTSTSVPAANDPGWTDTPPPYFSVTTDGTYTLYPWVKDTDGNVSAIFGSPRIVVVDTSSIPSDVIIVNTDADNTISGDEFCTLREAINNANSDSDMSGGDCAAGSGDDTITFAGYYVIEPSGSYPFISSPITIIGYGTANTFLQNSPMGSYSLGVFIIDGTNNLTLENLTMQNFLSTAIYNGIGIVTIENCNIYANDPRESTAVIANYNGTLTIMDSIISENTGEIGGGIYNGTNGSIFITNSSITKNSAIFGGGIYNLGNLSITHSTLSENSSIDLINGRGGGIYTMNSTSTLSISDTTLYGNTAVMGAGIYRIESNTSITDSNITGNSTGVGGFDGGSIYSYSNTFSNFDISNCLINNNFSDRNGGGIYLSQYSGMTVTNSTLSGNSSTDSGGGIRNQGTLDLINVTINDNLAGLGGGISNFTGILKFSNTIIANSANGGDCQNIGTLQTNINNLIEDGTCSPDFTGDPNLGPLNDNGGPTFTHALLENSPAIDAGESDLCPLTDQRGVKRPQGSGCDIGAFELENLGIFLPLILR
jgi:CSLREA domain-containing protein